MVRLPQPTAAKESRHRALETHAFSATNKFEKRMQDEYKRTQDRCIETEALVKETEELMGNLWSHCSEGQKRKLEVAHQRACELLDTVRYLRAALVSMQKDIKEYKNMAAERGGLLRRGQLRM